jgi:ATP-binding cassette subfamily F protein uup
MELDFGKIYLYDANYDSFLALKAERLEEEEKASKHLKQILKSEKEWMGRGVEARRTKNKARIERFKALSEIEFNEQKSMEFSSIETRLGKKLISMKHASKAFGDNLLFQDFSFDLAKDDIIGVVGDNGAGKSTLFRILMGLEPLSSGELIKGETLKIGYFSQNLELIDPEIRVIDYIKDTKNIIDTLEGKMDAETLLENFLFSRDLQYTKVKMLSGGEKRRLQLVKVLIDNPNVLLFDEPTNDLDLYTLEILENYLMDFKGPILVVSHDRYFLDKICNKLFIFKNGYIEESLLSFSEYLSNNDSTIIKEETIKKEKPKANRMPSALRRELEEAEERMPKIEKRINEIEKELEEAQTDYKKLMELSLEKDNLSMEYDSLMERYFELLEIKESYKI